MKRVKRYIAFFLVLLFLLPVLSCGKKTQGEDADESDDPMAVKHEEASVSPDGVFLVSSDLPYYKARPIDTFYELESDQNINITLTAGNEAGGVVFINCVTYFDTGEEIFSNHFYFFDTDGNVKNHFKLEDTLPEIQKGGRIFDLQMDEDGNLFLITEPHRYPQDTSLWIYKINQQGELLADMDVLELPEETAWFGNILFDRQGLIYALGMGEIVNLFVFDENLNELYKIEDLGEDIYRGGSLFSNGENMFVKSARWVNYEYWEEHEFYILPVDAEHGNLGEPLQGIGVSDFSVQSSADGLYLWNQTGIFYIADGADEIEEILLWSNQDIDFAEKLPEHLLVLSHDKILVSYVDDHESQVIEPLWYVLERQDINPNANKKILQIGGYQITEDTVLQKAIYLYNQSSKEVRAEIVDYFASKKSGVSHEAQIDLMRAAILSGNGTDVFYGMPNDQYPVFARRGYLSDLKEKIETEFSVEEYYENILLSTERYGEIHYLFPFFGISGYNERSSLGRLGWTFSDIVSFGDPFQENASLFSPAQSYEMILKEIMAGIGEQFLDISKEEAYFDSPEFVAVLEFVKEHGSAEDIPLDTDSAAGMTEDDVSSLPGYLNEKASMISAGKIAVQTSNVSYSMVGINSGSPLQKEAWEFIKILFTEQIQGMWKSQFMFPVHRSIMQKAITEEKEEILSASYDEMQNGEYDPEWEESYVANLDAFETFLSEISMPPVFDQEIFDIIMEEVRTGFAGQVPEEEIAKVIQEQVTALLIRV